MRLITKRVTNFDDREEIYKMYNRYLRYMKEFDDDEDYIEFLRILDNNGDVIDECKRFK